MTSDPQAPRDRLVNRAKPAHVVRPVVTDRLANRDRRAKADRVVPAAMTAVPASPVCRDRPVRRARRARALATIWPRWRL